MPQVVPHLGGVQASAEYFPVRGVEPGKMQVKAPYLAIPDLHGGEMAIVGHRSIAQLIHGGVLAIDLDMCHRASLATMGTPRP